VNPGNLSNGTIDLLVILFIAAYAIIRWWFDHHSLSDLFSRGSSDDAPTDGSLLLAMFTPGATLTKLSDGQLDGKPYRLLITEPLPPPPDLNAGLFDNQTTRDTKALDAVATSLEPGRILLMLDLPAASPVHIAGFGLEDQSFYEALAKTNIDDQLTRVDLEGDFPKDFRLYCNPGRDVELRQVLDPATMQFLADTSTHLQWELFESNLIFAESDKPPAGSNNSDQSGAQGEGVGQAAQEFLNRVLPTLQRMDGTTQTTPQAV
jgi:hypothetical protein